MTRHRLHAHLNSASAQFEHTLGPVSSCRTHCQPPVTSCGPGLSDQIMFDSVCHACKPCVARLEEVAVLCSPGGAHIEEVLATPCHNQDAHMEAYVMNVL